MSDGIKFIDPELTITERAQGFTRFEVVCVDPTTKNEFPMICFLPEDGNVNDIIARLGELSVVWLAMYGLDGILPE